MRKILLLMTVAIAVLGSYPLAQQHTPLRVFIRSGPKSHGPGAHDHPRFLKDWVPLLNARGARADGADAFPTKAQLDQTDVLILHAQEAGNIPDATDRKNLAEFLARGGGLVTIHAGNVSRDPDWFRTIAGSSWRNGTTKWLEGPMQLYFTDRESAITKDMSNWAMDDEIYYDMDLMPDVHVLAAAYTPKAAGARNAGAQRRADELTGGGKRVSVYDIQPQIWTYERTIEGGKTPYRSFVSIPGHLYENFNRPNYRALLLRGIAWAGKRTNVDEFLKPDEEGDALRYVEGGPTAPAKAAAKIEVHPEFDLSLVAAEPLIHKAMNIDWDEKGRLWVSETPEYPNGRRVPNTALWKDTGSVEPTQQRDPEDTISILSDTNGDGIMDRRHVFADKLELVTGFVFYKNGVIAATAPDIWYLEDTNKDEVADKRTKLYTGLGTQDTHAVINNLRWGMDGWIYATHGYSVGMVTSPDGKKEFGRDGSGVVRFKPDGSAFEQYSSRGGNTWGLDITWDGQVFWTQPTSGTVFFHTVLPEFVLAKARMPGTTSFKGMISGQNTYPAMKWPEQAYVQIDLVGQFTAAAGCAVYEGGAWPEKWNYAYFTGEPTLNIVHQQFVTKDGVSYTTRKEQGREETEFIRSTDMWFRPIETRVGPDGALYVIDFYNQAVIHNDTRGPLHGPANAAVRPDRDHYFARIWKVQHKQARKLTMPALNRGDLPSLLRVMQTHPNAQVKQTAWRLAQENFATDPRFLKAKRPMGTSVLDLYERAQSASTGEQRRPLLDMFAQSNDNWTRSAIAAAATGSAAAYVTDSLGYGRPEALTDLVSAILPSALPADAGRVLTAAAGAPGQANPLKPAVVRAVAQMNGSLSMDTSTTDAVRKLLADPATAAAALPIVARWDTAGTLKADAEQRAAALGRELGESGTSDDRRAEIGASLLSMPAQRTAALSAIEAMLAAPQSSDALKTRLITTLGNNPGADTDAAMISALARTGSTPIFDQLMKRPESATALLAAMKAGRITPAQLGPANVARLRTHPNRDVAQQASTLLDALTPQTRQRAEVVAALTPEVEKPGDAARGKVLFTAACASCHKLGDVGKEVGPPLAGMGAHGRAELLGHIVDPNREVDPSFWQWNVTTKKGETLVGVIAGENASGLTLRSPAGDVEIKKEDIATRENTRRSLMPEGLDSMGAEALRDILTFIAAGDQRFRIVDLRQAYTASSRRGFKREDDATETIPLHRFGDVSVGNVPFFVMDPAKSGNGTNLLALKGGPGTGNVSDDFPQKVEIPTSVTAASLHFLGGVGVWAWPNGGDAARGKPVMKVTVQFADGTSEEHVLRNGEHFADALVRAEVPLSKDAGDFTGRGQLRYFAFNLGKKAALSKIVLESYDTDVVPATIAITAGDEPVSGQAPSGTAPQAPAAAPATPAVQDRPKAGGKGDAPLPDTKPIVWAPNKTRVLVIGGGSSHNFGQFFGGTDVATLNAAGFSVNYTEDRDQAAAEIGKADVAVISVNRQFFDTPEYRKALFDFAAAGKGLVMLHPGTWYGYTAWPELNATIIGGGARGHDKIAKYSVNALKPEHPVMKGVPKSFEVEDELYYLNAEPDKMPAGVASIDVLAETSPSVRFKQPHPAVWITSHPKARIVGITLGHDERVHDLAPFKTLLTNAVTWAARR